MILTEHMPKYPDMIVNGRPSYDISEEISFNINPSPTNVPVYNQMCSGVALLKEENGREGVVNIDGILQDPNLVIVGR